MKSLLFVYYQKAFEKLNKINYCIPIHQNPTFYVLGFQNLYINSVMNDNLATKNERNQYEILKRK